MVLRRGLALIGIGLGVGLLASLGAVQSLKSFLCGVSQWIFRLILAVAIMLLAVGSLAALIPARGAASIEPTQALRRVASAPGWHRPTPLASAASNP